MQTTSNSKILSNQCNDTVSTITDSGVTNSRISSQSCNSNPSRKPETLTDFLLKHVNEDAENNVLASMILSPSAALESRKLLNAGDFYKRQQQELFSTMVSMIDAGRSFDPSVLKETLKCNGTLDEIGENYFFDLVKSSNANGTLITEYAAIVRSNAAKRRSVESLISKLHDVDHMPAQEDIEIENRFKIFSFTQLVKDYPQTRPELIVGLLRRTEIMNAIAPSKFGKSHLIMQLALAIATGGKWLNYQTHQGRVLIIDSELHHETLSDRARRLVADIAPDALENIHGIALRTLVCTIPELTRHRGIMTGEYSLIVVDALYKLLTDRDENSNSEMAEAYRMLDELARASKAAVVVVHHVSKGLQTGKSVTDTGAGAGSISRSVDTHLIVREHQTDNCWTVDVACRSFKQPDPFVIEKQLPLFIVRDDLDPRLLKLPTSARAETRELINESVNEDIVIGCLSQLGAAIRKTELQERVYRTANGASKRTCNALIERMIDNGQIIAERDPSAGKGNNTPIVVRLTPRDIAHNHNCESAQE